MTAETSPDRQDNLAPQPAPQEPAFDYRILRGHYRADGTYKTDEQLRMQYLTLTDNLIEQMTEGVTYTDRDTHEYVRQKPDYVIFLDKSGRPLAWLVNELWNKLAPEPGSDEVPKKPEFRFLNIDRDQWEGRVDPENNGNIDTEEVKKDMRDLRYLFVESKYKKADLAKRHVDDGKISFERPEMRELTDDIYNLPAELDGKVVLIVDEVKTSGRTLDIATEFIKTAFPTANVAGTYWMSATINYKGARRALEAPVWYNDRTEYGRGIGNRADVSGRRSITENMNQRRGKLFLSTRFPRPDGQALQLRKELHHLATQPDVPVIPSNRRPDEFDKRLSAWNGADANNVIRRIREIKGLK